MPLLGIALFGIGVFGLGILAGATWMVFTFARLSDVEVAEIRQDRLRL
jgi:hypothetical protein